jgi:hypothetical protein
MNTIYKISKNELEILSTLDITPLEMVNPNGMTISHYACTILRVGASLLFEFEGVEEFIPYIKETEFCTVVRKKVDLTAVGANGQSIEGNTRDIGKYNYKAVAPSQPLDLPPGFTEFYRK